MTRRLIFRVGEERVALPAEAVREIVPLGRLTRVPQAPSSLLGLANVRGRAMPVLSLATLLGLPAEEGERVIVLDREEPVGLAVAGVPRLDRGDEGARVVEPGVLLDGFSAGGRTVLRGSGVARLQAGTGEPEAQRQTVVLLLFDVAGQSFALPLDQVEELLAAPREVTALPGGDRASLGSIPHRGAVLPLLSLGVLLNLGGAAGGAAQRVVVVRIGDGAVGLLVDAVEAVLRVTEDAIDPVPTVLTRGGAEAKIQAIVRRDGGRRLTSLLATQHLLAGASGAGLRDERGAGPEKMEQAVEPNEHLLIFRLGNETFGLPIAAVREVVALPEQLTRMPRAPAFVEGLMNLRGQAIPVIDQRRRFDAPAGDDGRQRRVIVVSLGGVQAGFAVDGVSEVLRVPASLLRPAPEMGEGARMFDRVASLDEGERIILVVEPEELLDRAERDLLAAMARGDADRRP